MVEVISEDKNRILEYMGKSLEKYGPDKMNVDEIGKLADAIKDMAEAEKACWEAEYYRSVTEAMEGQGYTPDMMGYQGQGGQGGGQGGNRGSMGYNRNRDSMGRYTSGRRGYHEGMDGLRAEIEHADGVSFP